MSSDDSADDEAPPKRTHDPRSYDARQEGGDDQASQGQGSHGQGQQGKDKPGQDGGDKGDDGDGKSGGKKKGMLASHPLGVAIAIVVLLILLIVGLLYWLHARDFESTDDAFIDTHMVRMAPRISGRVLRVLVEDNQRVGAGQGLVEIDPRDYQARLNQAQATRAQADAQIAQAQAQLVQVGAQVDVNQANVRQTQAAAVSNEAQANYAASDLARYQTLKAVNPSAVAQQQLDQSSSQAASTVAQREAALRQIDAARAQVQATGSQKAGAEAQIAAGRAQQKSADAQIQSAALDLSYTLVRAPEGGTVAQRTVAIGAYVAAGAQLMAIVPLRVWVTANFKETQLSLMRPGQGADIKVDACPGDHFRGHVDSIQRGSGQAFGILPPENATGNFVKVVQRVPVKIVFDNGFKDCPLGPGLSVEPKVRVR